MKQIGVFFSALIFFTCSSEHSEDVTLPVSSNQTPEKINDSVITEIIDTQVVSVYSSEVFETKGLGWGYKIFENGTLFINQPHIPAIQGNKGFSSKEKAQRTADFAIYKMNAGFIPPTISPEELDSLGVL